MRNRELSENYDNLGVEPKQKKAILNIIDSTIENSMDKILYRFEAIEQSFNGRFESLEKSFNGRFESLETSFNGRFESLEKSFDKRFNTVTWAITSSIALSAILISLVVYLK